MYINESQCCTHETNMTLWIKSTVLQKKKKKKERSLGLVLGLDNEAFPFSEWGEESEG